jgi:phage-related holin
MKTNTFILSITTTTATMSFVSSYFFHIYMGNIEQFLALLSVIFIDGFFGILAGIKREGFQTRRAVKVLQRAVTWIGFLTVILMVEKGFAGAAWMSETIVIPFIVLQLMSALKNASMAGFIKAELLNDLLDRIDKHKGIRK